MIPLFDAVAHPTLSGDWLGRDLRCGFDDLSRELDAQGYAAACAIGLAGIGDYTHEAFIEACRQNPKLIPVAGVDAALSVHEINLPMLKSLGYVGIKLHPRFSKVTRAINTLLPMFQAAAENNLVVFYCTYMHGPLESYPTADPFYELVSLLAQARDTKVVLVHGGDVNLLRYAELVRFNPNLLLDLSLTMMKYAGSSIDMDVRFLFELFDRRIAIGSDYPEYSLGQTRQRFEYFADGLSDVKKHNIAYNNLSQFLGMDVIRSSDNT